MPAFAPDDSYFFVGSDTGDSGCTVYGENIDSYSVEGFALNPNGSPVASATNANWVANPITSYGSMDPVDVVKLTPSGSLLITMTDGNFVTYSVSNTPPQVGALTLIGTFPSAGGYYPPELQMDPTGHFMLLGVTPSGGLGVYSILPDGSVAPVSGSPFPLNMLWGNYAFSISGKYVLAVDANDNLLALSIDSNTGALTLTASVPLPTLPQGAAAWAIAAGGR